MAEPKKKSLDLLIAVGKNGPKPAAMPPAEDAEMPMEDTMAELPAEDAMPAEPDGDENCITLPPGFKAPDGSEDGKPFTTTVRGKIMDGKFYPESIGDMPLDGTAAPAMDEQEAEAPPEDGSYAAKKAESDAARNAFQPGR